MTTLLIAAACLQNPLGKVLLVRKRGTGCFMLPGGKRELNESPLQALQRELNEELLLELPESAFTSLGHYHAAAANEAQTWIEADIFTAHLNHEVTPAAELEVLHWYDPTHEHTIKLAPLLTEHVLPALYPSPALS